jgi:hypothetical protein
MGRNATKNNCFKILKLKVSALYLIGTLLYPTKAKDTVQEPCGRGRR